MGLIIKDKIKAMIPGFPTVSDKYNVSGGILTGSSAVEFGELVQTSGTPGYFEKATSVSAVTDICGFAVGTNVKLNTTWPSGGANIKPGEAFNLLVNGFIAAELDSGATGTYITPNAAVYVILATGKLTTSDNASAGTVVQLDGCVFTGFKETQGSSIVAEIYVK